MSGYGSPPQVRGKPGYTDEAKKPLGITPAGAGKTIPLCLAKTQRQDHPRRCGENFSVHLMQALRKGSPPQVRGKLFMLGKRIGNAGITPAGAGKTSCRACSGHGLRDHPRRCGENLLPSGRTPPCAGSPPQVRGKLCLPRSRMVSLWITPAGAGKTSRRCYQHQRD